MELAEGSLADLLVERKGKLTDTQLRSVIEQVTADLEYIHGLQPKIVHRDIKPDNILMRTRTPLKFVLTDFGISSIVEHGSRVASSVSKTTFYAAPEAGAGDISAGLDWWSLGMIVAEAAGGRRPFGDALEQTVNIHFARREPIPLGAVTDYIQRTADGIVPATMKATFQGEALTFRSTVSDLSVLMIAAVFVMYVILGILYESYLHPITVLSALPVALLGGLATLVLFGAEASLYAYIGMFMLMGIVKKNGIMIVDFALQRIAQGETAERAIHDASMDRFRPILMTTLAAVMGAVPIALGFGADGSSRRPLGLVIVGGLIVSQFITLYVTPAIYLYLEDFQEKVLDRTSFFQSTRTHHAEMDEMLRRSHEALPSEIESADGRPEPVLAGHGSNGH